MYVFNSALLVRFGLSAIPFHFRYYYHNNSHGSDPSRSPAKSEVRERWKGEGRLAEDRLDLFEKRGGHEKEELPKPTKIRKYDSCHDRRAQ